MVDICSKVWLNMRSCSAEQFACGGCGGAASTTPCGSERGFLGSPTTRSVSVSHRLEGVLVIEHPTNGADGVGVPLVEVGVH